MMDGLMEWCNMVNAQRKTLNAERKYRIQNAEQNVERKYRIQNAKGATQNANTKCKDQIQSAKGLTRNAEGTYKNAK
jgi:hypothetical protein